MTKMNSLVTFIDVKLFDKNHRSFQDHSRLFPSGTELSRPVPSRPEFFLNFSRIIPSNKTRLQDQYCPGPGNLGMVSSLVQACLVWYRARERRPLENTAFGTTDLYRYCVLSSDNKGILKRVCT